MSKKLDEIKKTLEEQEGGISDEVSEALAKCYVAGRDETVDWAKKNVHATHDGWDWIPDPDSLEKGKTAKELQP